MPPIETQNATTQPPPRRLWTLERAVNAVVLLAAASITVYNVYQRLVPPPSPFATRPMNYPLGHAFTLPKPYRGGDRVTIALLLSRGCHFCTESAPFYRRLASTRTRTSSEFKMVAVFPNAEGGAQAADYLKTNGVDVNEIQTASFLNLGVGATPTLLVLDESHKVTFASSGLLGPAGETQVISSITKLCPSCTVP
jgi:hypothetical protein